jgi:hypothetical protein
MLNNQLHNIKNAMMVTVNNGQFHSLIFREIGLINMSNNTVDRWLTGVPIPGGANPYVNIAAYAADPLNMAPNITYNSVVGVNIIGNTFNKVYNGASVMNFGQSPVFVTTNTISMLNEAPNFCQNSCSQKGIFGSVNNKHLAIYTNSITGQPLAWGDSLKGIMAAHNGSLSVRCNTVANTGRAIEFDWTQTVDYFEDNSMIGSTLPNPFTRGFGFVLDHQAKINAPTFAMGTQGRPTNNIWQTPWGSAAQGGSMTATYNGSSAKHASLYIQYVAPFDPDGSGFTDGFIQTPIGPDQYVHTNYPGFETLLNVSVFPSYSCRLSQNGGAGGGNPGGQVAMLEQIATQGFSNQINPIQSAAIDRHFAYRTLKANPTLMVNSATLTNFYNNAQGTSLQGMVDIENSLANNNVNAAQSQINAFNPANSVETNYKTYYQVVANWKDSTYTQNDSISLRTLADGCPYVDGMVVFEAQALYNAIYGDYFIYKENCGGNNQQARFINRHNTEQNTEQNMTSVQLKSMIFPNPNNGNFVLRFSKDTEKQSAEISIFDITGRQVYHESRQIDKEQQMNLGNDLLNGTYLVKVKMADGTTDVHRLVINK